MNKKNQLIRIYTGTEISVLSLKDKLEKFKISSLIQNDYNSGRAAGVLTGVPSAIDLYIQQSDFEKAKPLISEFLKILNPDS